MKKFGTKEELFEALGRMSDGERLALEAYARQFVNGSGFSSSMDLIHEAIARTLEGRRNWPAELDLGSYLAGCARSIGGHGRTCKDGAVLPMDVVDGGESGLRALSHHPAASVEALVLARERRSLGRAAMGFARRTLAEDPGGLRVLEGIAEGLTPAEMEEAFDMPASEVKAAKQRVLNRMRVWIKGRTA